MSLHDAADNNDVVLLKTLVVGGANVNGVMGGWTALLVAAREGFVECARVLLEANADVDKACMYGWTPLIYAAMKGRVDCVRLLIMHKANFRARTNMGYSPMHSAAINGRLACVEELIRVGASRALDVCDSNGFTPLALAIHFNHPDCAELLLDGGAKMMNLHKCTKIPDWTNDIIAKGRNVKQSLKVFIGVLRRRFTVVDGTTEHLGNRIPRDVVQLLSIYLWKTRFNRKWLHDDIPPEKASKTSKKNIHCVLM